MSYQFNSYVNRQEAEALKEMIFRRARERSSSMTSDVQADVMNIAHEAFVSKNNPFSMILNQTSEDTKTTNAQSDVEKQDAEISSIKASSGTAEKISDNIGFPQKNLKILPNTQNKIIEEQVTAAQIHSTMREARNGLANRKSFMGALEFLNSQAAASLLNKRASGLDMVV